MAFRDPALLCSSEVISMRKGYKGFALLASLAALYGSTTADALAPTRDVRSLAVHHSYFFVGGEYVDTHGSRAMHGQMFVEELSPKRRYHKWPILMIHGGGQTATNWMGTPDGREVFQLARLCRLSH
jgi:hypothetical protein